VLAKPSRFRALVKIVSARRRNQHPRRTRYPEIIAAAVAGGRSEQGICR
jgi:hypothetical protein